MSESIKRILIKRDGISAYAAELLVEEARDALQEYLAFGNIDAAYNVCAEYFGLEPDYLSDLMN